MAEIHSVQAQGPGFRFLAPMCGSVLRNLVTGGRDQDPGNLVTS